LPYRGGSGWLQGEHVAIMRAGDLNPT